MSKVWITLLYCAVYWTSSAIHANAGEYIFGFNTMASIIVSVRYNTQYMQCGYHQCDVQLFPPNRCSAQIWDSEEAVSVLYMTWNLLVLPNSANPRCDATHYSWNSYGMPYCTYYSHPYTYRGAMRHITCGLAWAHLTIDTQYFPPVMGNTQGVVRHIIHVTVPISHPENLLKF